MLLARSARGPGWRHARQACLPERDTDPVRAHEVGSMLIPRVV